MMPTILSTRLADNRPCVSILSIAGLPFEGVLPLHTTHLLSEWLESVAFRSGTKPID